MLLKKLSFAGVAMLLTLGGALAQSTITPKTNTPAAATPATTTTRTHRTTSGSSTLPAGTKVNVNTASEQQLDALPQVGKARAKVIMSERAKTPFKDWNDFDTRTAHTSVNKGVKAKIKDMVTF